MTDEVLREIHAIKDDNAERYRSFAAMMKDLRKRQEKSGRRIIRAPVRRRKPTATGGG
jgi:hypothetical protein